MRRADPRRSTGRHLAAGLAATALLLTGCTSGSPDDTPVPDSSSGGQASEGSSASGPAFSSYAALGDSYTAAPFVPTTDLAEGCLRSNGNYPSLLAAELDVTRVRDVSCSGAETGDVAGPQSVAGGQGRVPPQIRAVTRSTDLVTVGLGGNDENLFGTLVACVGGGFGAAPGAPAPPSESACTAAKDEVAGTVARTSDAVTAVLRQVTRAAPDATVVLVGYPRLLGDTTGCRAFPVAADDVDAARRVEVLLRDGLARAARRAGTEFLDVYRLSAGHEICSDDPWVNGRRTDQSRALAFHPFAEEQQAVADALARLLEDV